MDSSELIRISNELYLARRRKRSIESELTWRLMLHSHTLPHCDEREESLRHEIEYVNCLIAALETEASGLNDSLPAEEFPDGVHRFTLNSFIDDFLSYARDNHRKPTVNLVRIAFRHLLEITGDCPLDKITPEHADKYRTKRLKEVKAGTVSAELRSLRSAFGTACKWRRIASNPFSGVKLPQDPKRTLKHLTKEEASKLLSVIDQPWLSYVVKFALGTGLRRAEITNLKWKNIDLNKRVIKVESDGDFQTKQGRMRSVPISTRVMNVLVGAKNREPEAYVFSIEGMRIKEGTLSHAFKKYVRRAHLDEGIHFHSLRHTCATWLSEMNVPIDKVQQILGHSDVSTTQIYSHPSLDAARQALEGISLPEPLNRSKEIE